jgi:hypothetical protein
MVNEPGPSSCRHRSFWNEGEVCAVVSLSPGISGAEDSCRVVATSKYEKSVVVNERDPVSGMEQGGMMLSRRRWRRRCE